MSWWRHVVFHLGETLIELIWNGWIRDQIEILDPWSIYTSHCVFSREPHLFFHLARGPIPSCSFLWSEVVSSRCFEAVDTGNGSRATILWNIMEPIGWGMKIHNYQQFAVRAPWSWPIHRLVTDSYQKVGFFFKDDVLLKLLKLLPQNWSHVQNQAWDPHLWMFTIILRRWSLKPLVNPQWTTDAASGFMELHIYVKA